MDEWRRHAIYFAPPEGGPLARLRRRLARLGPRSRPRPRAGLDLAGLPAPAPELVAGPDRYGFHATLKPPFRLAPAAREAGLAAAVAALAARHAPFALELAPAALSGFVALCETRPCRRSPRSPAPA